MGALEALVERARKADASLAAMERNIRLGRYQGRNSSATTELMIRRRHQRDQALRELYALGGSSGRRLVGCLMAEAGLRRRVSIAREEGQARPELRERLALARRRVRLELAGRGGED